MSQDEDEMLFDDFLCDSQESCESQHFTVLSADDVISLMKNETEKVREIVNLNPAQLRMLLTKHKWDIDSFLEKFYDGKVELPAKRPSSSKGSIKREENKENKGRQSKKRKMPASSKSEAPISRRTRNNKGNAEKECDICAQSCAIELIHELDCSHFFCRDCLKLYIETAVNQGNLTDCIKCPGYDCNMPIDDDFVDEMLPKKLKPKYKQLIASGFVVNNRLIKWCPSPDCSNAVKVDVGVPNQPAVRCLCGFQFCFSCNTETHNLIPCKLVQEFEKIKASTLRTANWVVRFTKQCPQCRVDIEKNGGCHHITCRQCHHEFCWICAQNWRGHSSRNCVAPAADALPRTDMRRLANYDTKFHTMRQSIKLDQVIYKAELGKQLEDIKDEWFKIDFVVEAVELLLSCRRTLVDSFIFYYFFEISESVLEQEPKNHPSKVQWLLFATNHAELAAATEKLSRKLETNVNAENIHEMKREIKDLTFSCKGFQTAVTQQVAEGFENNVWHKRKDSI